MNETCADCGTPMRQSAALACGPKGAIRLPLGDPYCPSEACTERRVAEGRADQAERDEAAIKRAIEAGVIDP